jgi:hypothetical protein
MSVVKVWFDTHKTEYGSEDEALKACAKHFKLGVVAAQQRMGIKDPYLKTMKESHPDVGLSEHQLREKIDPLFKLEQAVKEIPAGKFIPEAEFRSNVAKLNATQFRAKADLPQFNIYKGRNSGVIYWGKPASIKKLKDEGILQSI